MALYQKMFFKISIISVPKIVLLSSKAQFSSDLHLTARLWNTLDIMLRADTILCNNNANCITSVFVSNLRKHLALFLDDVVWSSLGVVFALH